MRNQGKFSAAPGGSAAGARRARRALRPLDHAAFAQRRQLRRFQAEQLFQDLVVTPFDREDIAALAQRMDDVMDYIEGASTAIRIYGISQPTTAARGLADLIRLQCVQLEKAVSVLRHKGRLKSILEQLKEINRLENEADSLYLDSMAELFRGEMNAVDIIKWRDVYDQLEEATDSCEQVAYVLEAIVLKHA